MSGTDHRHAVGGLFRAHYPWLCTRLRQQLGIRSSVEDLAAETFAQLLESPNLTPIREPRALLYTIAQRLVYQLWRRRDLERRHVEQLQHLEQAQSISPEDWLQLTESLQGLAESRPLPFRRDFSGNRIRRPFHGASRSVTSLPGRNMR